MRLFRPFVLFLAILAAVSCGPKGVSAVDETGHKCFSGMPPSGQGSSTTSGNSANPWDTAARGWRPQ